jgi:hypothetical protein
MLITMHPVKNENVFQIIDTNEKAYWLGFLYADGYIGIKNEKLQICLSVKDETHLDRFILFIEGSLEDKRFYGPYKTSGRQVHYSTRNKKIISDLLSLGCVNKKSKIIRFPELSTYDLQLAFLQGYYDGDGSAGKGRSEITCGSKLFLEDVKRIFCLENKISKTLSIYDTYRMNLCRTLYRKMVKSFDGLESKSHNLDGVTPQKPRVKKIKTDLTNKPLIPSSIVKKRFEVTKEELQKLVDTLPLTKIGKLFNVSDSAIKKRCKKLGIPLKGRGYWSKQHP